MDIQDNKGLASASPIFDGFAKVIQVATGAVLLALVLLVCTEVLMRSLMNLSLGFAEEVTGYCVVMLTFFGAAMALRSNALFQVSFIYAHIPSRIQIWVHRLFILMALITCLILAWKTQDLMFSSLSRGKFAPTVLRTPLWIPQLIMPIGFSVLSIFLIEKLLLSARKLKDL
ncbi:MAG: TRAP transporter small permease [Methylocystaceae bacterium]|nr:TRAP transporter small permease [Methylocystaceae bacterium]